MTSNDLQLILVVDFAQSLMFEADHRYDKPWLRHCGND